GVADGAPAFGGGPTADGRLAGVVGPAVGALPPASSPEVSGPSPSRPTTCSPITTARTMAAMTPTDFTAPDLRRRPPRPYGGPLEYPDTG
ncbi:MAG TPA: hypothetical protein VE617_02555, partial [Propionibacteriaceae bacterium]|nr:hypothetical protein [Propionibacteriaceae bacterium]